MSIAMDAQCIQCTLRRNIELVGPLGTVEKTTAFTRALMELMDSLAAGASEEQLAYLTDIFVNCSRYELGFWDMSWEMRA